MDQADQVNRIMQMVQAKLEDMFEPNDSEPEPEEKTVSQKPVLISSVVVTRTSVPTTGSASTVLVKTKTKTTVALDALLAATQKQTLAAMTHKGSASDFKVAGCFYAYIPFKNTLKQELAEQGFDSQELHGVSVILCRYGDSDGVVNSPLPSVPRRLILVPTALPNAAGTKIRPILDQVKLNGGSFLPVTNAQKLIKELKNSKIGQPFNRQACVRGLDRALDQLKIVPNTFEMDVLTSRAYREIMSQFVPFEETESFLRLNYFRNSAIRTVLRLAMDASAEIKKMFTDALMTKGTEGAIKSLSPVVDILRDTTKPSFGIPASKLVLIRAWIKEFDCNSYSQREYARRRGELVTKKKKKKRTKKIRKIKKTKETKETKETKKKRVNKKTTKKKVKKTTSRKATTKRTLPIYDDDNIIPLASSSMLLPPGFLAAAAKTASQATSAIVSTTVTATRKRKVSPSKITVQRNKKRRVVRK
jgi:hypothetical protein